MSNPWLQPATIEESADEQLPAPPPAATRLQRRIAPQPSAVTPRPSGLALWDLGHGEALPALWWVGAHGGAGETMLEQLVDGSRAAGHRWPITPDACAPAVVVLVARTHAAGLRAAQRAVTGWASGAVDVDLAGLVLVADAPGRLPRVLRELVRHVSGGVPEAWTVPWVEAWRFDERVSIETAPRAVIAALGDLGDIAARSSTPPSFDSP